MNDKNDITKINMIRDNMQVAKNVAYFNTGTSGPLSSIAIKTIQETLATADSLGRGNTASYGQFFNNMRAARQIFADIAGSDVESIALTHHTTEGMNIIIHGLKWQPGDEILITNFEHQGGYIPTFLARQKYGVDIRVVNFEFLDDAETVLRKIEAALTPRTRLFVFSHVSWNTGFRFPLNDVVALCHRHHVMTLVDAAQSAGALALDLSGSGVDFYAMPAQKWLCGPEGIGALYVRPDRISLVSQTYAGFLSLESPGMYDKTGYFMPAAGARRYEMGTINKPALYAFVAHMNWLKDEVGWEWIYNRINELATYAYDQLSRLPTVEMLTRRDAKSGLITFNLEGYDPPRLMTLLNQEGVVLRYLSYPYALRASVGFYNTHADINRMTETLHDALNTAPENLPEYVPPY